MPNITFIQWNSRGLTKARLEEFRYFLSTSTSSIYLVCETFWNNNFSVKFRSYNVINNNRVDRHGGGVAILINKSIPFTSLNITNSDSIEAVGVEKQYSIFPSNYPDNLNPSINPKKECLTMSTIEAK